MILTRPSGQDLARSVCEREAKLGRRLDGHSSLVLCLCRCVFFVTQYYYCQHFNFFLCLFRKVWLHPRRTRNWKLFFGILKVHSCRFCHSCACEGQGHLAETSSCVLDGSMRVNVDGYTKINRNWRLETDSLRDTVHPWGVQKRFLFFLPPLHSWTVEDQPVGWFLRVPCRYNGTC